MKTAALIFALAALTCGALQGQKVVYKQAETITTGGVTGMGGGFGIVSSSLIGGRTVAGSPFTATEQRHSLQVLGDGTRIEQTGNSQISRDAEGRTRIETLPGANDAPTTVTIQDPVAGVNYFIDSVHKTVIKLPFPKGLGVAPLPLGAVSVSGVMSAGITASGPGKVKIVTLQNGLRVDGASNAPVDEDLGVQTVNGVLAKGTRTTIDIPAGRIGNDRPLHVVNERWYSDDLGMIVKSSNSDPRFGTTTYDLTNISRGDPDPSLFQVPADYTLDESKAAIRAIKTK